MLELWVQIQIPVKSISSFPIPLHVDRCWSTWPDMYDMIQVKAFLKSFIYFMHYLYICSWDIVRRWRRLGGWTRRKRQCLHWSVRQFIWLCSHPWGAILSIDSIYVARRYTSKVRKSSESKLKALKSVVSDFVIPVKHSKLLQKSLNLLNTL